MSDFLIASGSEFLEETLSRILKTPKTLIFASWRGSTEHQRHRPMILGNDRRGRQ